MASGITKFLSKWIHWIKFKGWFIFDLPYFIKERKYTTGLELGAKAGRSMYYTLKANKSLHLTGIDLWEIIPGGAYKRNNRNEDKCKRLLQKFSSRITLIKGDAFTIADTIENKSFDFIFYDLQCKTMSNFHKDMIAKWLPKIKTGGVLIGRDFREFRQTFYELGFEEKDIEVCTIGKRLSERLEYIVLDK
jgi:SAM-dependent methyltransferase